MIGRNRSTLSVLFAEDAKAANAHYAEYLRDLFDKVYQAYDGQTAWKLYNAHHPEIVLLDIKMPGISGLEIAKKIRQHDSKTRIIIATAYSEEQHLLQAVELGLTRFLPKPFKRKTLKAALDKAVCELRKTCSLDLGNGCEWNSPLTRLTCLGQEVNLTAKERTLLTLLASQPGQTVSFSIIELALWPETYGETDSLPRTKALIKRLRKKLPEGSIRNVYGEGYRLRHLH